MEEESLLPEPEAISSKSTVGEGEDNSTQDSDSSTATSSTPQIDLDSYAKSLKKVVTDLELPVPITMGVMGRIGCGKHEMLNKFASKINTNACGVACPDTAAPFVPKEYNWIHKGLCCSFSFFNYMIMWTVLFILTNVAIILGMLFTFKRLDKDFKIWWIKNFQPEKYSNLTTVPATTPDMANVTGKPTAGSIIDAVEDHVAIPILIAVALLSVILLCAVLICVMNIVKSTNPESFGQMMRHFRIVLLMLLCETPSVTLSSTDFVDIIPVYFNAWVYAGTDNLWACIVEQLFNRTEEMFGYWKTRLYRQTEQELSHEHDYENMEYDLLSAKRNDVKVQIQTQSTDTRGGKNTQPVSTQSSTSGSNTSIVANTKAAPIESPVEEQVHSAMWREKIPYYGVAFLVLTAITTSVSLLVIVAVYIESTDVDKVYAYLLQAVGGGILGVTLLTQIKTIVIFLKNLCVSQSGRIKILNKQYQRSSAAIIEKLGFMHKVKSEIKITMGFIKVMEQYYGKRFRILIMIEDLDRCKDDKIRDIFEVLQLLLSDHGDPIVSLVNIDPDPVCRALSKGGKNGRLELERLVNLRFCMPEVSSSDIATSLRNNVERQTKMLETGRARALGVAHSHQTNYQRTEKQQPKLDTAAAVESFLTATELPPDRIQSCNDFWKKFAKDGENEYSIILTPFRLKMTLLATREVETNTDLLDNSYKASSYLCYTIRMSVACWTAQLKNYQVKKLLTPSENTQTLRRRAYMTCVELAQWLIITQQWPYRASWILYSIDQQKLSDSGSGTAMTLLSHYNSVRKQIYSLTDWTSYLELDGEETDFLKALSRFKTITPELAIKFMPYTTNIDRGIKTEILHSLNLSKQLESVKAETSQ